MTNIDRDVTLMGDGRVATTALALVAETRKEVQDVLFKRVFAKIKSGDLTPAFATLCWCELYALHAMEKSLTKKAKSGQNASKRLQQENPHD